MLLISGWWIGYRKTNMANQKKNTAFIGLGSNLEDRAVNIKKAIEQLKALDTIKVKNKSSLYETSPVGFYDQDDFLNMVCEIETTLLPYDLLRALQQIEKNLFRSKERIPLGPRIIDLDILIYEDEVICEEDLEIPHPYLQDRKFVLVPLAEIAPYIKHPVLNISIQHMLDFLETDEVVELYKDRKKSKK